MTTPEPLTLDAPTLRFCAALARAAAERMPKPRAHHACAAGALRALAEEIEVVAKGGEGR